jgi:hypothetical protein
VPFPVPETEERQLRRAMHAFGVDCDGEPDEAVGVDDRVEAPSSRGSWTSRPSWGSFHSRVAE